MAETAKGLPIPMFAWLRKLFGGGGAAPPRRREVRQVERQARELEERRQKLLYEAMERDEEIQRLFRQYKEAQSDLLKKELTRTLTIKKAEYESLSARLERLGEAAVANTRRSAFLQSFLDLPQVTEADLDRLDELQVQRREQERRSAVYADRVIGLTEMSPETSIEAQRLQRETIEALEREDREREKKREETKKEERREVPEDTTRKIEERLAREAKSEEPAAQREEPGKIAEEEA